MIEEKVFSNQVHLILEKVEQSKSAAIGFYFATGSRFEDEHSRGISHFTEHMLFKGTRLHSAREISKAFDSMGANANAFTEREAVCLFSVVPALDDNVSGAVKLFCDMSQNCIFPEEEFQKEKNVVINEIQSLEDDADESGLDEAAAFVWKGSSLSKTIGGSVEEVQQITREQMIEWYRKYFIQGELTVFVSGNFDEEEICSQIENLPPHKKLVQRPEYHFENASEWKSGFDFCKANFAQEQLYVLYPFDPELSEKENYALSVMNTILGDSVSSRLFDVLREQNGLCYNVFSFFTTYEKNAAWCASLSCDKKNIEAVCKLLFGELNAFVNRPFLQEELNAAKKHVMGEELIGSLDMEYAMRRNEKNFRAGIPMRTGEEVVELIQTIELEDVNSLARKIFDHKNRSLVVYGPALSHRTRNTIYKLNNPV